MSFLLQLVPSQESDTVGITHCDAKVGHFHYLTTLHQGSSIFCGNNLPSRGFGGPQNLISNWKSRIRFGVFLEQVRHVPLKWDTPINQPRGCKSVPLWNLSKYPNKGKRTKNGNPQRDVNTIPLGLWFWFSLLELPLAAKVVSRLMEAWDSLSRASGLACPSLPDLLTKRCQMAVARALVLSRE